MITRERPQDHKQNINILFQGRRRRMQKIFTKTHGRFSISNYTMMQKPRKPQSIISHTRALKNHDLLVFTIIDGVFEIDNREPKYQSKCYVN
jgi:hypothetical protein